MLVYYEMTNSDSDGSEEEEAENTKEHELAEYATFCLKYGIKTLQ